MNEWTDFEKYVFKELSKINEKVSGVSSDISNLKGRAAAWGAIAGALAAAIGEAVVRAINHS